MLKGNPMLTAVLFGLPLGFFSLICYSVCCADIMDAEEDDDEDEGTWTAVIAVIFLLGTLMDLRCMEGSIPLRL